MLPRAQKREEVLFLKPPGKYRFPCIGENNWTSNYSRGCKSVPYCELLGCNVQIHAVLRSSCQPMIQKVTTGGGTLLQVDSLIVNKIIQLRPAFQSIYAIQSEVSFLLAMGAKKTHTQAHTHTHTHTHTPFRHVLHLGL
jgi:hypothetical protein